MCCFFFFKQKTAYEMRISDWSSDVCSSDLTLGGDWTLSHWGLRSSLSRYGKFTVLNNNPANDQTFAAKWVLDLATDYTLDNWTFTLGADNVFNEYPYKVIAANSTSGILPYRSEERRVGKEGVSTCWFRWSA